MKEIDNQLSRLFQAARKGTPGRQEPAYGLETRALLAWREARFNAGNFWNLSLLRRGLAVATVLMALSFWPMLNASSDPFSEYVQVAEATTFSAETP